MKNTIAILFLLVTSSVSLFGQLPTSTSLTSIGVANQSASLFSVVLDHATSVPGGANWVFEIRHGQDTAVTESVTIAGISHTVLAVSGGTETSDNVATMDSGIVIIPGAEGSGLDYLISVSSLKKTTRYYFRMYATLSGVNSPPSNEQAVQFDGTADVTRPTITAQPSASLITTTSALISWGVGETGLTNTVEYWRASDAHVTVVAISTTSPNVALTGLTAGGLYSFVVSSLDTAGNMSQASGTFTTTTGSTATGTYISQRQFGGTTFMQDNAAPLAIKEDSVGNVVVAGSFEKSVNFGGGILTATPGANDRADIFIAKYDSAGAYIWAKQFGTNMDDQATCMALDSANNVIVAGYFQGTVNFGGTTLTNAGSSDIFVAKYAGTNGALVWAKRFGGTAVEQCSALVLDAADNILICGAYGVFGTAVDFGGGPLPLSGGEAAFQSEVFVAKLTSAGVYTWANGYGGVGYDALYGIAINSAGDVAVVGDYQSTLNVGGTNMTSAGGRDVFVAKYNGAIGTHIWSRSGGGTGEDLGKAVGFDASGNVIITGEFNGAAVVSSAPANFGGTNVIAANGLVGMFMAKYSSLGAHTWSRGFSSTGPTGSVFAKGLAVDSLGNIVATGGVSGNAIFDGIYLGYGTPAVMLVKFNSAGTTSWAHFYDGLQTDYGTAVTVGANNNILVTGGFSYSVNFGGGLMQSPGGFDGFIAKFTP